MNISKARKQLEAAGLDTLIASSFENVHYASGYPANLTARNRAIGLLRRLSPPFVVMPRNGEPLLLIKKALMQVARQSSTIKDIRTYSVQRGDSNTSEVGMSSVALHQFCFHSS